MENYQDEIFDFLTTPEHFKQVLAIQEHTPMLRLKLIHEFWLKVAQGMEHELSQGEYRSQNWKVEFSQKNDVEVTCRAAYPKLMAYLPHWKKATEELPLLFIGFDHIAGVGNPRHCIATVWINFHFRREKADYWKRVPTDEEIRGLAKQEGDESPSDWCFRKSAMTSVSFDQNLTQAYEQLLPQRRGPVVEEFISAFKEMLKFYEEKLVLIYGENMADIIK